MAPPLVRPQLPAHLQPVELSGPAQLQVQVHLEPPRPATGPGPGAGGVPDDEQLQELQRLMPLAHLTSPEQRPLPLMPEPLPADGQRPASTHYGPFLIENLLIDACRYNAGRSTGYAAGFAEHLAELWPRLPLRARQQLRHDLQQLFARDDEARAQEARGDWAGLNPNEPLPLGMDMDRAAWDKVRQAWQRDDAAGA
jgi:hypothetical protein